MLFRSLCAARKAERSDTSLKEICRVILASLLACSTTSRSPSSSMPAALPGNDRSKCSFSIPQTSKDYPDSPCFLRTCQCFPRAVTSYAHATLCPQIKLLSDNFFLCGRKISCICSSKNLLCNDLRNFTARFSDMKPSHLRYLLKSGLLFAAYFSTATLGLKMDAVSGFATLVWPPSGIALASLALFGYALWPAIALGALIVNLLSGAPAQAACGIAVGNVLEALLGAYWLRRFSGFQGNLCRVREVLALVLLAALAATTVSATVGVSSLWLTGVVNPTSYGATWSAWWIGDMLGILLISPLLLTWTQGSPVRLGSKQIAEAVGLFL